MADPGRWAANATLADVGSWAVGVAWALVMGWVFIVAAREQNRPFTSRFECGTDPMEILRVGELIEKSTLRIIVDSHCANARYPSDDRIELQYGGLQVQVETLPLSIGETTYYKIVSVGGERSE